MAHGHPQHTDVHRTRTLAGHPRHTNTCGRRGAASELRALEGDKAPRCGAGCGVGAGCDPRDGRPHPTAPHRWGRVPPASPESCRGAGVVLRAAGGSVGELSTSGCGRRCHPPSLPFLAPGWHRDTRRHRAFPRGAVPGLRSLRHPGWPRLLLRCDGDRCPQPLMRPVGQRLPLINRH